VAESLVAELVADALLDVLDRCGEAVGEQAEQGLEWLKRQAEPPAGVVLHASDGSAYTGLVAVERNQVVLMLAVKHPSLGSRTAPYTPERRIAPQPSYYEHHGLWGPEEDPYRR